MQTHGKCFGIDLRHSVHVSRFDSQVREKARTQTKELQDQKEEVEGKLAESIAQHEKDVTALKNEVGLKPSHRNYRFSTLTVHA